MAFWDYTGTIGRGIGTVIGAWFGGPAGAYAGGMAGEMEGNKIGAVGKGEADWTSMLSPGPAQQAPQEPTILDPQGAGFLDESWNPNAMPGNVGLRMASSQDPVINGVNQSTGQYGSDIPEDSEFSLRSLHPGLSIRESNKMAEPEKKGIDFGGILSGIGNALQSTAAGLQGDNYHVSRLKAQMDQQMNSQQALRQREQEMGLRQLGAVKEAIPMMEWIRDNTDPSKRESATEQAYQFVNERTGGFFSKEMFAGLMEGGSGALEEFRGAFELADELPPRLKAQLATDWKNGKVEQVKKRIGKLALEGATRAVEEGKEIPSKFLNALSSDERKNLQEQTSSKVFNTLMAVADKTVSMDGKPMQVRDMTPQQLRQNGIANFGMLTEDDKLELGQTFKNIKAKDVIKSELIEGRNKEAAAEREANVERRHAEDKQLQRENMNRLAGQFQQTNAIMAANLTERERAAREREIDRDRITNTESEPMRNTQQGFRITKDLRDAHAEATKGDKPMSGALRGLLTQTANSAPRSMTQISREQINKLSPAEQKLAAQFNVTVGNLRAMTPERQLSNEDAIRNLASFMLSNSPKQVQENLAARLKDQELSFNAQRENLRGSGKIIPPNLEKVDMQVGQETPATAAATAAPRPRATNPKTLEVVEWDGKAWVKVK